MCVKILVHISMEGQATSEAGGSLCYSRARDVEYTKGEDVCFPKQVRHRPSRQLRLELIFCKTGGVTNASLESEGPGIVATTVLRVGVWDKCWRRRGAHRWMVTRRCVSWWQSARSRSQSIDVGERRGIRDHIRDWHPNRVVYLIRHLVAHNKLTARWMAGHNNCLQIREHFFTCQPANDLVHKVERRQLVIAYFAAARAPRVWSRRVAYSVRFIRR